MKLHLILALWIIRPTAAIAGVHQLRHRVALLNLAVKRGALGRNTSLGDATDALGGILDVIDTSWTQVTQALAAIQQTCQAQVNIFASRAVGQDTQKTNLQVVREGNLVSQARLQAELDYLSAQEAEAQASYDSTVVQRASATSTYVDTQAIKGEQRTIISQVLAKLREKQVLLNSGRSTTGESTPTSVQAGERYIFLRTTAYAYPVQCVDNLPVQVTQVDAQADPPVQVQWDNNFTYWVKIADLRDILPVSAGTSSRFGTIIGVFMGMLSAVAAGQTTTAQDYAKQDAELLNLVNAYKDTLQHIDTQYATKNSARAKASALADDAQLEISLRTYLARQEATLSSSLQTLCGFAGTASSTGAVHSAIARGTVLLATLKKQVEQALVTMQEVVSLEATTLLQVDIPGTTMPPEQHLAGPLSGFRSQRTLLLTPKHVHVETSSLGRARKWLLDAVAKGVKALPVVGIRGNLPDHNKVPTQRLASPDVVAPAATNSTTMLAARPSSGWRHWVKNVSRSAQLRALAAELPTGSLADSVRMLETVAKEANRAGAGLRSIAAYTATQGNASQECMEGQTQLTAQIIVACETIRNADSAAIMNTDRVGAITAWSMIVQDSASAIAFVKTTLSQSFASLNQIAESGSYDNSVGPTVAVMATVQANVTAYMAEGAPPLAAGLPLAMGSIQRTLVSFRDAVPQDLEAILDADRNLMLAIQALQTRLSNTVPVLQNANATAQTAASAALQTIQDQKELQQDLMAQRTALEARCEQAPNVTLGLLAVHAGRPILPSDGLIWQSNFST